MGIDTIGTNAITDNSVNTTKMLNSVVVIEGEGIGSNDNDTTLPTSAAVKDYAARARDKKLKPEEMDGSTFTISNLGMFGIQEFTSIINQPNGAILSVGAIVQKPVVKEGEIVVGNTMKLTLACDHRVVDGATGALFLQTLRTFVENPLTMVVT